MNSELKEPLLAIGIYKTANDVPTYCIAFVGYKDGKMILLSEPRYQRDSLMRSVLLSEQGIYTTAKQAEKQLSDGEVSWIIGYSATGMDVADTPFELIKIVMKWPIYTFPDSRLTENQVLASEIANESKIAISSQPETAAVTAAVLALKGELNPTENENEY
jgi:hypothetical protein